jgi:phosphatidylserine decarboxylase
VALVAGRGDAFVRSATDFAEMPMCDHVRGAMTFVRWGIPTLICATLVLAWALYLLPAGPVRWCAVPIAAFCWLFTLAFFRNPRRKPLGDQRCLIAPADGVVSDIGEAEEPLYVKERCVRIGIFLSVFDVHVNRSPVDGVVEFAQYRPGKFLDARHPDVTHANEANILGISAAANVAGKLKLLVVQLSGLIARRIICTHGVGDALTRGELYGMIKFGSRTELWIPLSQKFEVKVKVGDRVMCGETILIELK